MWEEWERGGCMKGIREREMCDREWEGGRCVGEGDVCVCVGEGREDILLPPPHVVHIVTHK